MERDGGVVASYHLGVGDNQSKACILLKDCATGGYVW